MAKQKTVYICQECGSQSVKWIGKCPACNQWNTYSEEILTSNRFDSVIPAGRSLSHPLKVSEIDVSEDIRWDTHNVEFNRVLGGGIVPGSVILIAGEPGIGKSTLALQIALTAREFKTLYISGEESQRQIKLRADRLQIENPDCLILSETLLEEIILQLHKTNPDFVVIDSIQTLFTEKAESSPGTVTQIRECTAALQKYAKENHKPVLLIGHINKEGNIAGPKVLEHIVDTVLQFEGDRNYVYRILRSVKNRFGSTSEMGIYEMHQHGLREVDNPSELLLSQNEDQISGTAVASTLEGMRPFLIEVQALVSTAVYGNPQRSSTGFDLRRLNMLLAVLEKRAGFRLSTKDVFLNIAGGIRVDDPAIDLAVIAAVLSSSQDISINKSIAFAGEVGLTGEIRPIDRVEQRIAEAEKLGFKEIYVSKFNFKKGNLPKSLIKIKQVARVEELVSDLF